jgi:hypothetical protein
LGGAGSEGADFFEVRVAVESPIQQAFVHLLIRSEGPAGAALRSASWNATTGILTLCGDSRLTPDPAPD